MHKGSPSKLSREEATHEAYLHGIRASPCPEPVSRGVRRQPPTHQQTLPHCPETGGRVHLALAPVTASKTNARCADSFRRFLRYMTKSAEKKGRGICPPSW